MRITLIVDEDVAVRLQRLRATGDRSLKQIVNEALRRGLKQISYEQKPVGDYHTRSVDLGRCLIGSIDDSAKAFFAGEGDRFQ